VLVGARGAADLATDVERAQLTDTIAFGADVPFLRAEQALCRLCARHLKRCIYISDQ
jgi:hypothetical protein